MKGLISYDEYTNWVIEPSDIESERRYNNFWTFSDFEEILPHSEEENELLVSYLEKAEKNFYVISKLLSLYLLMNSGYKPENFEKAIINVHRDDRMDRVTGILPDAIKYASSFVDSPLLTSFAIVWRQINESYKLDYEKTEKHYLSLLNDSVKKEISERILGEYYIPGTSAAFWITDMGLFYLFTEGKKGVLPTYDPEAFVDDGYIDRHFPEIRDEIEQIVKYTGAVQKARARIREVQIHKPLSISNSDGVNKRALIEKYPRFEKDLPLLQAAGIIIEIPEFYIWCDCLGNLGYYFKCLSDERGFDTDAVRIASAFIAEKSGITWELHNTDITQNNKRDLGSFAKIRKILKRDLYTKVNED